MAKGRHALNPAKVKRDARAALGEPDKPDPARRAALRRRITVVLLALLTVVLMNVAHAPFDAWPLGYVALAPWVLAVAVAPTRRWGGLCGWAAGLLFWATSLYWLTWITMLGYVAGVLYLSLYFLVAALMLRSALRRGCPAWIAVPIFWTALEYLRAHASDVLLGPAFPWFFLAHTQYARTMLIQIADVTGQYGVSFFVGMVNGLAVDAAAALAGGEALRPARPKARLVRGGIACAAVLAGMLGYGAWQLSRETTRPGPVIGIVQRAYPISLAGRSAPTEVVFDSHLAGTGEFRDKGVDLVLWPETMLPRGLNPEVLNADAYELTGDSLRGLTACFFGPSAYNPDLTPDVLRANLAPCIEGGTTPRGRLVPGRRGLAKRVTTAARLVGCPILAGGTAFYPNPEPLFRQDWWTARNGALWFDPNGSVGPVYAKRRLVPFSESVPFKKDWTWLHVQLRQFVPPAMEQLEPGPAWTRFELARPGGTWRLVSPICYEGTFADVCRAMVYADGEKRADIIANLSNDGWFIWQISDEWHHNSTEQAQHLSHYCFRAVENRTPVVRAVNTGISASIDSCGRIVAQVEHAGKRVMVPGTLLLDGKGGGGGPGEPAHGPKVLVDSRTSWYSRLGDLFAVLICLVAAAATGVLIRTPAGTARPAGKERPER